MEINKVNPIKIDGLGGLEKSQGPSNQGLKGKGPSFEDLLNQGIQPQAKVGAENVATEAIKFSNHALDRIRSRGIKMGPEQIAKLETAVSKAENKGAKETLVLMDSSALIVNIKNKTVVTALDQNAMKENVFTNIDSTIIL